MKPRSYATDLLKRLFHGGGDVWLSLHGRCPGSSGLQTFGECDWLGYERVRVPCTPDYWTVDGFLASNAQEVLFPQCVGRAGHASHFGIGRKRVGDGLVYYCGPLSGELVIPVHASPLVKPGQLVVEEA